MWILIFSTNFIWNISHFKKNSTSARYSLQASIKLEFSREILKKQSNVEFYENFPNGSRVFPCGRTTKRTDGQTHTAKLIFALKKMCRTEIFFRISLEYSARRMFSIKIFYNQILDSKKTHSIAITTINNLVMLRDK
jgi:hypothetical protein